MKKATFRGKVARSLSARWLTCGRLALAVAAIGVFSESRLQGAVIYSEIQDIRIPQDVPAGNFFEIYIDFESRQASTSGPITGWDVNIFNFVYGAAADPTAQSLELLHPAGKTASGEVRSASFSDPTAAAKLEVGSIIGPAASFTIQDPDVGNQTLLAITDTGTSEETGDWGTDATRKFLGVRFVDDVGATKYGWIRLTVGDGPAYPFVVHDWAYESSGAAITAGTIPEPGLAGAAVGALAIGVMRRPRKR